jgi:hypothetical protein
LDAVGRQAAAACALLWLPVFLNAFLNPLLRNVKKRNKNRAKESRWKSTDPPRTFSKSKPTHPPVDFFNTCFEGGVQKHHTTILAKIPCFFSRFLFYRVFGHFSATGVQKHYKKLKKKSTKNRPKNRKLFFSRFFYLRSLVFGRFSARGARKHHRM